MIRLAVLPSMSRGFTSIAQKCASLNLPTVIVREGGYICDQLGGKSRIFCAASADLHSMGIC